MIYISHRGNIDGPNPEMENSPEAITYALALDYDVEIDVWYINGDWFLGHDKPQYETTLYFLRKTDGLWIHCKNYEALEKLTEEGGASNFFYHTNEDYALTSQGFIWAYPNKSGQYKTICVMPEWNNTEIDGFYGVCSDYIERYKYD